MLRNFSRLAVSSGQRFARAQVAKPAMPLYRSFAMPSMPGGGVGEGSGVPDDEELQSGRRGLEIDADKAGDIVFNDGEALVPESNKGTKEDPILIPSTMDMRTIGYEDPLSHAMVWFNVEKDKLYFVPDINLYFKLYPVVDEVIQPSSH